MEEKVLELTIHSESLLKEKHQSTMNFLKLESRNCQLDVNLKQRKLARVEIEQKLEETTKKLKVTKEKKLKLHNVIYGIDY